MIYEVVVDGCSLYDEDPENILINPSVEDELNAAGSCTFTIPANHRYYNIPKPMVSDVEIKENGEIIWFGRITKISTNWNNDKEISCVGALSFLNDSIQRPEVFEDGLLSIKDFFRHLIENHNDQVPANRQFTIGNVDIDEGFVYRKLNYETTYAAITDMCVDARGGYLVTRRENGINYIDWLQILPTLNNQTINYGINLAELTQTFDFGEFYTSIIPLGEENEETGLKTTCINANGGFDYIDSEATDVYGRITAVVEFEGLKEPIDVYEAGVKYLRDRQFDPITIDISAADLSYINNEYSAFRVGMKVHVTSFPHLIDKEFPIQKIKLNLDDGTKTITIGNEKPKELEDLFTNRAKEEKSSYGNGLLESREDE